MTVERERLGCSNEFSIAQAEISVWKENKKEAWIDTPKYIIRSLLLDWCDDVGRAVCSITSRDAVTRPTHAPAKCFLRRLGAKPTLHMQKP